MNKPAVFPAVGELGNQKGDFISYSLPQKCVLDHGSLQNTFVCTEKGRVTPSETELTSLHVVMAM